MTPHLKNKPRVSAFIKFTIVFLLLNQLKIVWLTLKRLMCVESNYQSSGNGDISIKKIYINIAKLFNGSKKYLVFLSQRRNEMLGKSHD